MQPMGSSPLNESGTDLRIMDCTVATNFAWCCWDICARGFDFFRVAKGSRRLCRNLWVRLTNRRSQCQLGLPALLCRAFWGFLHPYLFKHQLWCGSWVVYWCGRWIWSLWSDWTWIYAKSLAKFTPWGGNGLTVAIGLCLLMFSRWAYYGPLKNTQCSPSLFEARRPNHAN